MVTVIVPVFNCAEYLDDCVKSLLSQSYSDLQIILVDDRSTDGSGEKADEWAEVDPRVSVIHNEENSGISISRNKGLLAAKGDYISFVDADDYVDHRMFESLVDLLSDSGADISLFNFKMVNDGAEVPAVLKYPKGGTTSLSTEVIDKCITHIGDTNNTYAWNKLFSRKVVFRDGSPILFDNSLTYAEDAIWLVKVMSGNCKVVFSDGYYYNYRCGRAGQSTVTVWMKNRDSKAENIRNMKSAVLAFQEIAELLTGKNARASNNALQKQLSHQINGMKATVRLKDTENYVFFSNGVFSLLFKYLKNDHSFISFVWTMKKTMEAIVCTVKRMH